MSSVYPTLVFQLNVVKLQRVSVVVDCRKRIHGRKIAKNLRFPRRTKLPPEFGVNLFLKKPESNDFFEEKVGNEEFVEGENDVGSDIVWESDEIETIKSLFQGRIPQKPGKNLNRERALPLPLPYEIRPLALPSPKKRIKKVVSSSKIESLRPSKLSNVHKNPTFLIGLAKRIKSLGENDDVSLVLDDSARFLQKGSLSLTIRELGHMNMANRALQTFRWAQKQAHLVPDDRILASTVEVLARNNSLSVPVNLQEFTSMASRNVIEAMVRGFIGSGRLMLALNLVSFAKENNRILDASVYAKLILELGKNPDYHMLVLSLLEELGEREDLDLKQQDCTAIMKICIRLGKFHVVESLYNWFKQSGRQQSVVMYTTLIHSRYSEKKFREALAVVWEMESSNCLLDFPAYRVVIRLFVALNDVSRAARYFSKLKEAGFSPTYDVYRDLIKVYLVSGRLAKCREIWKEAEMAGFKLDKQLTSEIIQLERETRIDFASVQNDL